MTKRECAIVMAYTGYAMLQGDALSYLYDYLKKVAGHSVWTHEIPATCDKYIEKIKADFISLCRDAEECDEDE